MKFVVGLLCLVLLPVSLTAGNIYEAKSKGEADVVVHLVGSEGEKQGAGRLEEVQQVPGNVKVIGSFYEKNTDIRGFICYRRLL